MFQEEPPSPFIVSKSVLKLPHVEAHVTKASFGPEEVLGPLHGGPEQKETCPLHFLIPLLLQLVPAYARSWKEATSSGLVEAPSPPGRRSPLQENGLLPPPLEGSGVVPQELPVTHLDAPMSRVPITPELLLLPQTGLGGCPPSWSLVCSCQMSHKEKASSERLETRGSCQPCADSSPS